MSFVSTGIGRLVRAKLAEAEYVRIATAFFSPSDAMVADLQQIPHLDLIVSEEFTVNDPHKLSLLTNAAIRSVPTDDAKGKLHAKVFIAKLRDGSLWILIGSANLTQQGLFANQEACIELRSTNSSDLPSIHRIQVWFEQLFTNARITDLAAAKVTFDQRSRYRLEPRSENGHGTSLEYWAIKTTSGGAGAEEHWPRLLKEGVVAVGWEELDIDPSQVDDATLRLSLAQFLNAEKPGSIEFGIRTLRNFINMPLGSIIVLCRGFVPTQTKPVHVYAFARIIGPFRADPMNGTQWRFKRNAVIQEVGAALPASTFAQDVGKGSFRQTMHKVSPDVIRRLADSLGVALEV